MGKEHPKGKCGLSAGTEGTASWVDLEGGLQHGADDDKNRKNKQEQTNHKKCLLVAMFCVFAIMLVGAVMICSANESGSISGVVFGFPGFGKPSKVQRQPSETSMYSQHPTFNSILPVPAGADTLHATAGSSDRGPENGRCLDPLADAHPFFCKSSERVDAAIAIVKKDGMALASLDEDLQKNVQVVAEAVRQNALAFQFAKGGAQGSNFAARCEAYRMKPSMLVDAWKENSTHSPDLKELNFLLQRSEELSKEWESCIRRDEELTKYFFGPGKWRTWQELINAIATVQQDGMALATLHEFQEDFRVVGAAIQQKGMAFQFARGAAREHLYLQHQALFKGQDETATDVFVDAWAKNPNAFPEMKKYLNELAEGGYGSNSEYAQWARDFLRRVACAAVQKDGMALKNFPEFQEDLFVVQAAVQQNGEAVDFAKGAALQAFKRLGREVLAEERLMEAWMRGKKSVPGSCVEDQ